MKQINASLQLILSPDKHNPCFTLFQSEDKRFIHVYYGLEILEVIPADRNHPAYRMLVARLYNAGVKVSVLEEVFDHDHKTIRTWGLALASGIPDALQRMLFGPVRKLTPPIKAFIAHRWPELYAQRCRNYREVLQKEIKAYFGVSLSGESLRVMLNQLAGDKASAEAQVLATPEDSQQADTLPDMSSGCADATLDLDLFAPVNALPCRSDEATMSRDELPLEEKSEPFPQAPDPTPPCALNSAVLPTPESPCQPQTVEVVEVVGYPGFREWTCSQSDGAEALPDEPEIPYSTGCYETWEQGGDVPVPTWVSSKFDPWFWQPQPGEATLCDHAGVLIFAHALSSLPAVVDPPQPILAQWLASTLLGAHNIEQTKLLNWSDLGMLLGTAVRFPAPQRELLGALATPQNVAAILRWNYRQLGESVMRDNDFYLDPHTKHYTGMQRVLKGWCASIRWADKVMHGDFVHTAQGHPIYFEWVDNYDDLRVRFRPLVERMRATLGLDGNVPQDSLRTLTFVIDRGIYSNDLFSQVAADPGLHLITWQKGYIPGPWDETRATIRFAIERQRNNSHDLRLYQFRVIEQPWDQNPAIRQLIVRATNPEGKVAQLAVLTDDLQRPGKEIAWLIFNRWIQENDFKYIDKHMGIKQITSYRSIDYGELRDNLVDRQVPNELYVQKVKESRKLLRKKARLLLAEDNAHRMEISRQQEIGKLEAELAPSGPAPTGQTTTEPADPGTSKLLKALRQASQRSKRYTQARRERLDKLQLDLERIEAQKTTLNKEVSRKEQLIEQQMVRMDATNKTLMDAIKICARNLFYQALTPFKKLYDNNRDDHALFRELTRCDGALRLSEKGMEVHLVAHMHCSPKMRRIIGEVLCSINASAPLLPDGSGRKVLLHLTEKRQIKVQITDDPEDEPPSI
jgi:hypothetical protein